MMRARLIWAIVSTVLEEAALVAVVLWGLPQLDIHIPLAALIVVMVAWAGLAVFIFWKGTQALKKKPVVGLSDMVGSKGKVVNQLDPQGMVRIKGELWEAISVGGRVSVGREVTVVGQDGLKLIVRRSKPDD
jgi:membrane-bound ClpP family serine protease